MSAAKSIRYRHNQYDQLERLIEINHTEYERIIIVTESIFSMDGDEADLRELVRLKKKYANVWLYVDEAHAFGVRGDKGLGCAEEQECISDRLSGRYIRQGIGIGRRLHCLPESDTGISRQ